VWVRAFHETYDPSLAVRVLALVARDHPAATLTMLGRDKKDGSLEDAQKTAKELGVLSKVKFAGAVPNEEIPRHLDQHDVFLNTTRVDNTPVSVLEAMACGLLVVSTNVGGVPHLLTDATDALLVPPGDAEAMAAAVGRVLTEPELAARLSAAARARVLEMDWARVLPRWEALLLGAEAAVPAAAPAPTAAMGA
jgi:glycosyltransferase involved in cell wall biosynthesis